MEGSARVVGPPVSHFDLPHACGVQVVLGNHDYGGSVEAQYFFTDSAMNPSGLWQCRGDDTSEAPGRCFTFSRPLTAIATPDPRSTVQFFAFDANACQYAVRMITVVILLPARKPYGLLAYRCGVRSQTYSTCTRRTSSGWTGSASSTATRCGRFSFRWRLAWCHPWQLESANLLSSQHHPLYTQGKGHHSESVCLRKKDYLSVREGAAVALLLQRVRLT